MCGIAGIVGPLADAPEMRAVLGRMLDALVHRGPDAGHAIVRPGAALGARRLAIQDVAQGHQPVESEDGRHVLALNGEIYDHDAIRARLAGRGARFRSRSDTETLLHLVAERGEAASRRWTACSRRRRGTRGSGRSCWRATGWGRSRSSGSRRTATSCSPRSGARSASTPRPRPCPTWTRSRSTSSTGSCPPRGPRSSASTASRPRTCSAGRKAASAWPRTRSWACRRPPPRRGTLPARRRRSRCGGSCATRCTAVSGRTSPSASCSRAGWTPRRWPRTPCR